MLYINNIFLLFMYSINDIMRDVENIINRRVYINVHVKRES